MELCNPGQIRSIHLKHRKYRQCRSVDFTNHRAMPNLEVIKVEENIDIEGLCEVLETSPKVRKLHVCLPRGWTIFPSMPKLHELHEMSTVEEYEMQLDISKAPKLCKLTTESDDAFWSFVKLGVSKLSNYDRIESRLDPKGLVTGGYRYDSLNDYANRKNQTVWETLAISPPPQQI